MKTVVIKRHGSIPGEGTFGDLCVWSGNNQGCIFEAKSAELEWKDNQTYVSCIPAGVYRLRLSKFNRPQRFGRRSYPCYEVLDVEGRTYIKFHRANCRKDLLGCIGVGDGWGWIKGCWAVQNTTAAFRLFMEALDGDEYALLVIIDP